jgi:hypothetical protein
MSKKSRCGDVPRIKSLPTSSELLTHFPTARLVLGQLQYKIRNYQCIYQRLVNIARLLVCVCFVLVVPSSEYNHLMIKNV